LALRSRAGELLPLVPAAAIPLVYLHRMYQADTTVGPFDVFGSDVAIALTIAAALLAGVWWGFRPLLRPWLLWAVAGAFLALVVLSCFWRPFDHTKTHLISAAKLIEYALLAPALVLLFRRRVDVDRFLGVFILWSAAATGWGLLQFAGIVNEFAGRNPGQREPSFLGIEELAAVSAAVLAIAFAWIVHDRRDWVVVGTTVSGVLGGILAASVFSLAGVGLAAVAACVIGARSRRLTARRAVAIWAVVAVVAAGVFALRDSDITRFVGFVGHSNQTTVTKDYIQTGSQHVILAYIGLRMWLDHPVLGVGFERSTDHYGPYLAGARRRFSSQDPASFPSPQHPWGVQNLWVQALADLGVVGFGLLVATFAIGILLALRAPPGAALLGLMVGGALLTTLGSWNQVGLIVGLPIDALTWMGFGLAVVAARNEWATPEAGRLASEA
jgi:hypothetical protein